MELSAVTRALNLNSLTYLDNGQEYFPFELSMLTGFCSARDVALVDNSVDENLKFFAKLRGFSEDIEAIKSKVGLTKYDGSILVSHLSTDRKIMLNMAVVLLSDPEIFIFDEPTTGLD